MSFPPKTLYAAVRLPRLKPIEFAPRVHETPNFWLHAQQAKRAGRDWREPWLEYESAMRDNLFESMAILAYFGPRPTLNRRGLPYDRSDLKK